MYKQEFIKYNGEVGLVENIVRSAVESAVDAPDGNPVNVLFDLSVTQDDDVAPVNAYFKRIDQVQTLTRNLGLPDFANAVIDRFMAGVELFVKAGDFVSFSVNKWEGDAR